MEDVIRGVVVKLRPTAEQKAYFHKNFGCCRKAYNEVLARHKAKYGENYTETPSQSELNRLLMEAKKDFPYLKEVESTSLQKAAYTLQNAFTKHRQNKKRYGPPKFHTKRKTRCSFTQTVRQDIKIINGRKLTLRKYGDVEFRTSSEYVELLNRDDIKFNNITVTFDGLNYYASINIEHNSHDSLPLTGKYLGCDINSNVNGWLVTSDGQKEFFNIDHDIQMIKKINRLMAKCRRLSKQWKQLQKRLLKWYNKRTNKLNDYIEKLTYNLVKEYDVIVFEENYAAIKILIGGEQNMVFPLTRFIKRLKDKFQLYKPTAEGVQFVKSHNTSRTCHHCGHINKKLKPKTRQWICPNCGKTLDRDINAAINILNRWFNGVCPEDT